MITINTAEFSGGLYVRFNIPKNGKVVFEFSKAKNIEEAKRMMYFRNRNYIYKKLHTWLRQRAHALAPFPKAADYAEKLATIEELQINIEHLKNSSFWNLCSYVCRKSNCFTSVAPAEKSQHYKNYSREILPVLTFCIDMKGAAE
jgi:hypothetical protein